MKKQPVFTVSETPEMHQQIKLLAAEQGLPVPAMYRMALREWAAKRDTKFPLI